MQTTHSYIIVVIAGNTDTTKTVSTEDQLPNRFWFCRCMVSVGWRL